MNSNMRYSLNSLKGVIEGTVEGTIMGVINGDTRSSYFGSYCLDPKVCGVMVFVENCNWFGTIIDLPLGSRY